MSKALDIAASLAALEWCSTDLISNQYEPRSGLWSVHSFVNALKGAWSHLSLSDVFSTPLRPTSLPQLLLHMAMYESWQDLETGWWWNVLWSLLCMSLQFAAICWVGSFQRGTLPQLFSLAVLRGVQILLWAQLLCISFSCATYWKEGEESI